MPVAVAFGAAVSACSSTADEHRGAAQALLPHARSARQQQRAAAALAPQVTQYTAALQAVAAHRGEHADALRDEINRLDASIAQGIEEAGPAIPDVDALARRVAGSSRTAADLAVQQSGYVAGLLGAVSASCRTLAEVQLA